MTNDYLCGLFCLRTRPILSLIRDDRLQGVEFSPRSSMASSTRAPTSAPVLPSSTDEAPFLTNLNNPEISGYYSPPAPQLQPRPDPLQEVRGYYAPEPAPALRPNVHPTKMT
ncbi:hypothetical protein F4804DRAFT_304597 [Jackrogersella minutella]|nr:hypothetical protein F4804DRAFT_304597 [Jackrogersella minutella]